MLSYRHGFHAGNPADLLKHSVLVFCLDYLGRKEKPYLCVDTHAGAGAYPLTSGYAAQNREWEAGIGMLQQVPRRNLPPMLTRYLDIAGTDPYPGSPGIMKKLLRPQDQLRCFELHPADFSALQEFLRGVPQSAIFREDGFKGLAGLLPPVSRRACIFMDPSYEIKTDYETLPLVLTKAVKRFPRGLYMVWYPLLRQPPRIPPFPETLMSLYGGNRCTLELQSAPKTLIPPQSRGMYGSGLVIYNPPWTLKPALEETLPVLASLLGGSWSLRWEPTDESGVCKPRSPGQSGR